MCGVLHALDLHTLQIELLNMHKDSEGIPEYINSLEDAQAKAERAKVPVTDTMLMIIATHTMFRTEQFPRANEDWEEMDMGAQRWPAWKKLYCALAKKAAIKAKATGGNDLFGSANEAT